MSTNPSNKVLYGLSNVHYALRTVASDGTVSYGTPKKLAGAVNLAIAPTSEINKFYADNIQYYVDETLSSYDGTLEIAKLTDEALADIWGLEADEDDVLIENVGVEPKSFALLFQVNGDKHNVCHAFYNCIASRPDIEAETVTETKAPKTQTLTLTISPEASGDIHAKSTADSDATAVSDWFTSVHVRAVTPPNPED